MQGIDRQGRQGHAMALAGQNWRGIGKARRRPGTADRIGNADAAAIATLVQSIEHILPQILFAAPEMCAAGDVDQ